MDARFHQHSPFLTVEAELIFAPQNSFNGADAQYPWLNVFTNVQGDGIVRPVQRWDDENVSEERKEVEIWKAVPWPGWGWINEVYGYEMFSLNKL